MAVHSDGLGSGWLEDLGIDEPHGLTYREFNDLRIGINNRLSGEHAAFADATVGGIHKPGGAAILGIEDGTVTVIADGTLVGHGIVWDNSSLLWCSTALAGASTTGDFTILSIHPNLQWKGQDVTWAGAAEFDSSVDISGNVTIEGDVTIEGGLLVDGDLSMQGDLYVDGTADFSTIGVDGTACLADVSVSGSLDIAVDFSVDGTSALQDTVLTGDSTLTFDAIAGETGPTVKMFGDWSTKAQDVTYTARTDGMVHYYTTSTTTQKVQGQTPAGTVRIEQRTQSDNLTLGGSFGVKGGDTWAVTMDATTKTVTVQWLPFGDNT